MNNNFFPVDQIQKKLFFSRSPKNRPVMLWESLGLSKKTVILGSPINEQKSRDKQKPAFRRYAKHIKISSSPRRNSLDPFKEGLSFIHKVKESARGLNRNSIGDLNEKFCQTEMQGFKSQTRTCIVKDKEFDDHSRKLMSQERFDFQVGEFDKAVSAGEPQIIKVKKVEVRHKYFRKSRNLSAWENDIDLEFL